MAKKGVLEHPKTLTLADRLGIMDCFALGILEAFWHHVTDYFEDGDVTTLRPSVFARSIRYQGNPQELWDALIDAGFIDQTPDGKLLVHHWPEHCVDYIHTRFFRTFKYFADGTRPKPGSVGKEERERLSKQWDAMESAQDQQDLNLQSPEQSEQNPQTIPEQFQKPLPNQTQPNPTKPSSKRECAGAEVESPASRVLSQLRALACVQNCKTQNDEGQISLLEGTFERHKGDKLLEGIDWGHWAGWVANRASAKPAFTSATSSMTAAAVLERFIPDIRGELAKAAASEKPAQPASPGNPATGEGLTWYWGEDDFGNPVKKPIVEGVAA